MSALHDMQPMRPYSLREEKSLFERLEEAQNAISSGGIHDPFDSANVFGMVDSLDHSELAELSAIWDKTLDANPGDAYEQLGKRIAQLARRWAWQRLTGHP